MPISLPGYLRWALVKIEPNGERITEELPHPHRSSYSLRAVQPGNPSNSALGSFTIPLFPPYTREYKKAKPIYDRIDAYQRVEAYLGYSRNPGLGKMVFAGVLPNAPTPSWGKTGEQFELSGQSDLILSHLSKPFPGELLPNDVTSEVIKSYLGRNELNWGDAFSPYDSANYNSSNLPAHTSGTWSASTDDNLNVVQCSNGTGAALIAKIGGAANDRWHSHYVEATGRMFVNSTHAVNAGLLGIGISKANNNCSDSVACWAQAQYFGGRYHLIVTLAVYVAGVLNGAITTAAVLPNVDENTSTYIPITIGLLNSLGGSSASSAHASIMLNGKVVLNLYPTSSDPGTSTWYPFGIYGTPSSGGTTGYLTNLKHYTRFTYDGPSTASMIKAGTITAGSYSLQYGTDPGATFLEAITRLATRLGHYWRYTPQRFVPGTRTLGTLDVGPSPGTDYASARQVIYSRARQNLLGLALHPNADNLAGDTSVSGQPTIEGGGIGNFSDIATLQKYGVIQDEVFAFTNSDFSSLRRQAYQILQNKKNAGVLGAKTAIVLRNDLVRELDQVVLHDPETNINNLTSLIVGKDFQEGVPYETLYLDQFA